MIHFLIPLYNKGRSVGDSVRRLAAFLQDSLREPYEIVLCDDGSTDNTLSLVRKLAAAYPSVRVVGYAQNRGRGAVLKSAAKTCEGEYLIYVDLDFPQTTGHSCLSAMIGHVRNNDIVGGSRFMAGSKTRRILLRAVISRVYRALVYCVLPELKVRDIDVGFKGFKTACFKEVNRYSRMDGWAWDLECIAIARSLGKTIKEFPIDWNENYDGYDSAVNIFKDGLEELCAIAQVRVRSWRGFRGP